MNRRRLLKIAGAGALATSLAGCTGGGGNGDGGDGGDGGNGDGGDGGGGGLPDTVTAGWVHSLSGAFGFFGEEAKRGQELALDEINASDDLLPDTELVIKRGDSKTTPEEGLKEARRLVQRDGVDFLTGTTSSSVATALAQFASQANVPFFIGHSSAESLTTGKDCKYTNLRLLPHTGLTASASSQFTIDNFGGSVYMLYLDYSYGQAVASTARKNFEANGVDIVGETATPFGNEDFSTIVDDIKSKDPDVIFQGINGGSAVPFFTQASNRGLDTPMVCQFQSSKSIGQLTTNQFDKLGDIYRGSVKYTREIDTSRNKEFIKNYKDRFDGQLPDFLSAGTYVTTYFYAEALQKAGTTDTEKLIEAASTLEVEGVSSPIKMRKCDHQGMGTIHSAKVTGIDEQNKIANNEIVAEHNAADYITSCEDRSCSF